MNLHIIHLDILPSSRAAQHHPEHIGIAHRLEGRTQRMPPGTRDSAALGHTALAALVRVINLDRARAETVGVELEVHADGVVGSGTGAQRLRQGEGADAGVGGVGRLQVGLEGVHVAAGVGAAWLDDAVAVGADLVAHDPWREGTAFEAAVLDYGTAACSGRCCGR